MVNCSGIAAKPFKIAVVYRGKVENKLFSRNCSLCFECIVWCFLVVSERVTLPPFCHRVITPNLLMVDLS